MAALRRRRARARATSCAAPTGWQPGVLDLGGSLACPTSAPSRPRQFRLNRALGTDLLPPDPADCLRIADAAALAVDARRATHAAAAGLAVPRVVLEPGRALTGDTQFLLTTVVDVKDDGALAHAVLDAGINVAEPVPQRVPPAVQRHRAGAPATTAVPARRADLHAGRRALQPLAAAAAGARPRPGDHGHRRLLRAVLDDVLVPQAGDRDAGRRRRHASPAARDVRRHDVASTTLEPLSDARWSSARSAISPMIRARSKSFGV